jgi:fucose permease
MLSIYCLANLINNGVWIVQAPLFSLFCDLYVTTLSQVNFLSAVYMIMFLPLGFPSFAALDKYGLKTGLMIGTLLTTAGCVLKCLVEPNKPGSF